MFTVTGDVSVLRCSARSVAPKGGWSLNLRHGVHHRRDGQSSATVAVVEGGVHEIANSRSVILFFVIRR